MSILSLPVKHDLRHKARLVAGGHLTNPNTTDNTNSSVVSLRSTQIAIVAAELNNLDIMVGDVSFAYLEAYTQEKVCFIAGPEFGPLEGHLLVIVRASIRTKDFRCMLARPLCCCYAHLGILSFVRQTQMCG